MIPKVIHYCWFGKGEKSDLIMRCIESWKKFCPEYKIIEWNEDNFDLNCHQYFKKAYESKYYAFASDYARLKIIYENGGVYLDTDVELIKNIDFLLHNNFYCGYEQIDKVNTGLGFGAKKNSDVVLKMLHEYEIIEFEDENGEFNLTSCPHYNTSALLKMGIIQNNTLLKTADLSIYPIEYFSPKSYETGMVDLTKNTVSIHHFIGSWEFEENLNKKYRQHRIYNFWGSKIGDKIIFVLDLMSVAQKKGLSGTLKGIINQSELFFNKKKSSGN